VLEIVADQFESVTNGQ